MDSDRHTVKRHLLFSPFPTSQDGLNPNTTNSNF
jgi:hypothetical protein